jgi:hypothetical protein
MENETGTRVSTDEAEKEYRQMREAAKENSRFYVIEPETAEELELTGVIYSRHSTGTDPVSGKPFEKDSYDFEISETTPNGEHKVISFGKTNKIVGQLLLAVKSGQKKVTISRQGSGQATRYSLIEVKKKRGTL